MARRYYYVDTFGGPCGHRHLSENAARVCARRKCRATVIRVEDGEEFVRRGVNDAWEPRLRLHGGAIARR